MTHGLPTRTLTSLQTSFGGDIAYRRNRFDGYAVRSSSAVHESSGVPLSNVRGGVDSVHSPARMTLSKPI